MGAEQKMLSVMRNIAEGVYESRKSMNIFTGKVSSVAPLTVDCGGLQRIPSALLTVCSGAADRLQVGALVVILREGGGQKYYILDTVQREDEI